MKREHIQGEKAGGPAWLRLALFTGPVRRLLAAAGLGFCLAGSGYADELPAVDTAYSRAIFDGANLDAVRALTGLWLDIFGSQNKLCRAGEVHFYNDVVEWRAAARQKAFMLGVIQVTDFLQMEEEHLLNPCFVFEEAGGVGSDLLLVTHRKNIENGLPDLSGQELSFTKGPCGRVARMWAESLLAADDLPASGIFFGAISEKEKAKDAILSLLYSQKGVCVVTRSSFETIKQMNPQVGRDLTVLAESPGFVSTIICLLPSGDPAFDRRVRSALERLDDDSAGLADENEGHRILATFGLGGLQPYRPDSIQAVRELFETYGHHRNSRISTPETERSDSSAL